MNYVLIIPLFLSLAFSAGADPIRDYGNEPENHPLHELEFGDGMFGFSGRFRTIFDNSDYSSVRLPKPDERTFFQSDMVIFFDIRPSEKISIRIGPKLIYEFGNEDGTGSALGEIYGSGPVARLRLRADYISGGHHLSFGHIRDTQTPLTFELESVDDDLAAFRWRYTADNLNSRIFVSRLSVVGDEQYETFLGAVRFGLTPFKDTGARYGVNLSSIHQGGFDTGGIGGYPPVGERKREVLVVGGDVRQPIIWGTYIAGEGAYSISRSDVNVTLKDNAFWGELGWRNAWLDVGSRFYRVGRYFETPYGVDLLRNDEGIVIVSDFYAASMKAEAVIAFSDYARLYISFEQGWKWRFDDFSETDFEYNIEKVQFDLDL
ncbi:MAG: hypothetical protein GY771_13045 [bacterium]|nr:hypothetical protein [bacterium]